MCQGFYTGPGVSRYQYCKDDARLHNRAACDAASTCCGWVVPDQSVNEAGMTAADYCMKLNNKMGHTDATADANICTATTCCQMITELAADGVTQSTRCESKLPAGAVCEGSCAAKDVDNSGVVDPDENRLMCPLATGQATPCELVLDTPAQGQNTCIANPTSQSYYERNSWRHPPSQLVAGAGQVTNVEMDPVVCVNAGLQNAQTCTADEYCNYAQNRACNSCAGLATKDDCALQGLSTQGVTECKTKCFAHGPGPPGAYMRP